MVALARIRRQYMYRLNMVMGIVLAGVTIYLLTLIWRAAYGGRGDVDGISIEQMLVYLTIANLQLYFLQSDLAADIQARVREGQIGFDISRPVSYPEQLLAGGMGDALGRLPFLVVAVPIALTLGELRWPPSWAAGLGYLVSLVLAWLIAQELSLLVGMIAFWTLESNGFMMMYRLIGNFATGALIPFWFMPDAIASFFQALPFQSIAYIPVSIYIGNPAAGSIATSLAIQAFWAIALIGVLRWLWGRALTQTVVQGG